MAKATLKSIPVSSGEIIDLEIESMSYDNAALAHYKDFVIFVDRGAPGDVVQAEITTVRPDYARAKITELKKSDSLYRVDAPCKIFKVCGGCQWQHLPYNKQLEQKDLLLKRFFLRLNLPKGVLKNIIGASVIASEAKQSHKPMTDHEIASSGKALLAMTNPGIWNYRNKVQYPVRTVPETGRLKAGYFEWHSNELVNIKYCPIQYEQFDQILETVRELAPKYKIVAYDGRRGSGWLRHICVRAGINTGEALLTLVAINENLSRSQEFAKEIMDKHPELVGVCININTKTTNVIYGEKTKVIKGKGYIFEKIKDLKFKISATSFFQVNTLQAERLLEIIGDFIGGDVPSGTLYNGILDAYCGVGLIALSVAKYAERIIGIEEIKQSIEDAEYSAKENNIKNVTFINGKVENKIEDVLEKENPEVIILDPPRAGCNKKILESVIESKVKKIIYVSCNPSTLARDLEVLCRGVLVARPFEIKSIQPIDIFPHSYHVECVVSLER
ncbi:MAG: 23S rRNA (uracil-5-)-methyltransferase RumA [Candidatus Melainabacteria bacterium RIFCSPHIGHO2_02_FULL_34_12]|nr:MAG: 23S rRNA (uracil-5-)-methyltransferase RumA [Candidatus Melainabacteria bacterium RIFCSPHIGHO2_02_FULL_34_12]